jgi:hypothetical protein
MLSSHKELASKLMELERRVGEHDEQIVAIFEVIRRLMTPPETPGKRIGFEVSKRKGLHTASESTDYADFTDLNFLWPLTSDR